MPSSTQVATQAQAVLARQLHIEHDEVDALAIEHSAHAFPAIHRRDAIALSLQTLMYETARAAIAIDDKNVRGMKDGVHAGASSLDAAAI
jgi:hypothetical protein